MNIFEIFKRKMSTNKSPQTIPSSEHSTRDMKI